MLSELLWLGLEVKSLSRARRFYEGALGLPVAAEGPPGPAVAAEGPPGRADGREVRLDAGAHRLRLRRPGGVPRGGVHTHFAFATPPDRYEAWWRRLSPSFDLEEHAFGDARSLYCYDPDGNCVEVGQRGDGDADITGIFEVVLEVASLDDAEAFYADLGFEVVDRGSDRRRVRMAGPVDLELWEPHLGIADARGGVHVDLGFRSADPEATVAAVADRALAAEAVDGGRRVRDPDGHWLTVLGGT